ncbi:MAG: hypothetical protein HQK89_14430 [Nitrospirae bacterium]|nr:hypothetical protein [Nitrospirota bacterium]
MKKTNAIEAIKTSKGTKATKAIVTLAIGAQYKELWDKLCRPSWQSYAVRHGYDLICIDTPLDLSERAMKRSPAWQKCLILSQDFSKDYERIVWIDSDIIINASAAPSIVESVPEDMAGAINVWASPTPGWFDTALKRLMDMNPNIGTFGTTPAEYYEKYGLPAEFDAVVQTGVLVLSHRHREILEHTYYAYEEKGGPEWHYEMRPLSYEFLRADCVQWIDNRFNMSWPVYKCLFYPFLLNSPEAPAAGGQGREALIKVCVNATLSNGYFLHFPGSKFPDMSLVDSATP